MDLSGSILRVHTKQWKICGADNAEKIFEVSLCAQVPNGINFEGKLHDGVVCGLGHSVFLSYLRILDTSF